MPSTEILSIFLRVIIYAGIVQGCYSAVVLTHTRLRNPANNYLSILLLVLSFSIIHSCFIVPYLQKLHDTSFHIREPFLLFVVPLLWFYIKKLSEPSFRFQRKHLVHFIPFLLVMLFSLIILMHNSQKLSQHSVAVNIVLYMVALGQYVFYFVYMLRLINNFRNKAFNELSNTEHIDPAWLRIFLITFLIVIILLIIMAAIVIHRLDAVYFNDIISVVFACVIYILGYKGLFQQTIFVAAPHSMEPKESGQKSLQAISEIDEQLLNKLLIFMDNEKPYHDPELTLTSLATSFGVSRNLLSELINTGVGVNFYDFVNKYRVEEVKQLMKNRKYKEFTLLAIAFEAGFPSKSTFNSIFKKFTDLTPSEFKRKTEQETMQ